MPTALLDSICVLTIYGLQSEHAPDVEATNADGVSIQQLAAAAMTDSSGSDRPTSSDAQQAKRARHTYSETDAIAADASENEEAQWQARLREESGAELRGADEDDWDRCPFTPNP